MKKIKGFIDSIPQWLRTLLAVLVSVLTVAWCQISVEYCIPREVGACISYLWQGRPAMAGIGFICLLLPYIAVLLLSGRAWVSTFIYSFIGMAAAYANYYKKLYRGDPVLPLDLFYAGDALAMTKDVAAPFTKEMWISLGVFVVLLVVSALGKLTYKKSVKSWLVRAASFTVVALLTVAYFTSTVFDYDFMKSKGLGEASLHTDTYYQNSFYTSFLTIAGQQFFTDPPVGYDDTAVNVIMAELSEQQVGERTPDIIEILFESFEDMEPYRCAMEFEDLLVNYKAIGLEGVTGNMVTLGYGGGTGDVEYEVMTGLDSGDEMIQMVALTDTFDGYPSLPNYLKSKGYGTVAIHAYTSLLYHRTTAYNQLGFDRQMFIDSFEDPEMVGEYVSDAEMMRKIIEVYEQEIQKHDHVYIHGVSMQNHTPHNTEKMPESELVEVKGSLPEGDMRTVRNLATLTKMTDEALAQLIDYFRNCDRDVIIVLYGDHRAMLTNDQGSNILDEISYYPNGGSLQQLHQTPYLVWANFETRDAATYGTLSANMLLPYTLEDYGVISPAYFGWLVEESRSSDVIARSGDYVVHSDGTVSVGVTDQDLAELARRHIFQYNATKKKGVLGEFRYWGSAE